MTLSASSLVLRINSWRRAGNDLTNLIAESQSRDNFETYKLKQTKELLKKSGFRYKLRGLWSSKS
jgi:hypothetical protein